MKYAYALLFFVIIFTLPFLHFALTPEYWNYETSITNREEIIDNVHNYFLGKEKLEFFDNDVKAHFNDVRNLVYTGMAVLFGSIFFVAILSIKFSGVSQGLKIGGIAVISLWLIIGVWSLIDFNSFFWFFHEVFFEGNFSFPNNNLVIQTFPGSFWKGLCSKILIFELLLGIIGINNKKI